MIIFVASGHSDRVRVTESHWDEFQKPGGTLVVITHSDYMRGRLIGPCAVLSWCLLQAGEGGVSLAIVPVSGYARVWEAGRP
ncbi:hypothetical protein ACWGJ2_01130 [Streptomyces sp. NPDC054796]